MIFSLFAKSRARSNGILGRVSSWVGCDDLDSRTHHTPLRCIGPIFTTWRTFSLLRMPSRRPRVIPATFNSFVPLIIWLSARSSQYPTDSCCKDLASIPSLRATQIPRASTW